MSRATGRYPLSRRLNSGIDPLEEIYNELEWLDGFDDEDFSLELGDDEWFDEMNLMSRNDIRAPTTPPSIIPAYTPCDFIHQNIDVAAQYALYGMLKADPVSRNAAVQMLTAVKTERLGGIFQEDQKVPAMRAVRLGLGWYGPLISTYRRGASSAACIPPAPHLSHKLPLIAFKKALVKNSSLLGEQLRQVYLDCCKLSYLPPDLPPVPASGKSCTRPAPLPPPPFVYHKPGICIDPRELAFFDERSNHHSLQGKPLKENLLLRNCGNGELNWYAKCSASWLSISPSSGVATEGPKLINILANSDGLRVKDEPYRATITFMHVLSQASPEVAPVQIPVELYVTLKGPSWEKPKPSKPYVVDSGLWGSGPIPAFISFACGNKKIQFNLKNTGLMPATVTISPQYGDSKSTIVAPFGYTSLTFENRYRIRDWNFTVAIHPSIAVGKDTGDTIIAWSAICSPE